MSYNDIIQITDSAADYLKKIIHQQNGIGFRLSLKKAGCNGYMYVPDVVKEAHNKDIEITIKGMKVYLDAEQLDKINGTLVDLVDKGLHQQQLVFSNPRAKGECGCGESFNFD